MTEEGKFFNLGESFINGAVAAAESSMKHRPGRKLLSTIDAASKRHRNGLDSVRHTPLADYLGLKNCKFETNMNNFPYMLSGSNVRYQDSHLPETSKCKNSSLSQLYPNNCNKVFDVPKLSLLASAAIARDAYKAKKPITKTQKKKDDVVEMQNIIQSNIEEKFEQHLESAKLICTSCKTSGEHNTMLYCAACQAYCHIFCIDHSKDNIPDGWSDENWNLLTDWNKCDDEDSNRKLCENVKRSGEWICCSCTTIANFLIANSCHATKTKIQELPEEKRKKSLRRDKGEVMIWASHFPPKIEPTVIPVEKSQQAWTMIPNEVVTDVSNIDIVILNEDNQTLGQNQFDSHTNAGFQTNDSISKLKMTCVRENSMAKNKEIISKTIIKERS